MFNTTKYGHVNTEKYQKQSNKSHNAPVPYSTMHHFGTKMCIFMFQSDVLWDLGQVHCGISEFGLSCIPERTRRTTLHGPTKRIWDHLNGATKPWDPGGNGPSQCELSGPCKWPLELLHWWCALMEMKYAQFHKIKLIFNTFFLGYTFKQDKDAYR